MIARFGSNELNCVVAYKNQKDRPNDYVGYLRQEIDFLAWEQSLLFAMSNNAGFFPAEIQHLERFAERMLDDLTYVDILGCYWRQERFLGKELSHVYKVGLPDLEPYYHKDPWSTVLQDRKVLVVHPFQKSIERQYKNRTALFNDPKVLPAFELSTIKAVQSIAHGTTQFGSWFDALHAMEEQIGQADFDIAIIGCGAYGFPLAAHVKRMGKKAVHLGGATQILFGIRGKRWDSLPAIAQLMNEHWVRPHFSEIPPGGDAVEDGCYW
jgi:hypothetical protein